MNTRLNGTVVTLRMATDKWQQNAAEIATFLSKAPR